MMKKLFAVLFVMLACVGVHAQESESKPRNAFEVQGGLALSNLYGDARSWVGCGVGVGAYAGAGYEIRFTPHWSLMPKVEFAYGSNGAYGVFKPLYWMSFYTVSVPIMVNYRVLLRDNRALRFGVGPYGETVLGGRRDDGWRVTKNQDFEVLSTVGVRAEVAFELGSLVLGVGYKCSLRDKNVIDDMQTFSLGVGYRF